MLYMIGIFWLSAEENYHVVFIFSISQQLKIALLNYSTSHAHKNVNIFQHPRFLTLDKTNTIPITNQHMSLTCLMFWFLWLFTLLVLSGDIEKNPGPRKFKTYQDLIRFTEKKNENLKYACVNFQNLSIKHPEFKRFINDFDASSIIGITETWMDETINDNNWVINKELYKIFRCDRDKHATNKAKGGGVLLLMPSALDPKLRNDLNLFSVFESIWVEFRVGAKKRLVNISYNPNKNMTNKFIDELTKNIDNAIVENKSITLMGDYNINYLNGEERDKLDNCLMPYGLDVLNKKVATRISVSTKTLLDYIISDSSNTEEYLVSDTEFKTDHLLSVCIESTKLVKSKAIMNFIRDTKEYNKELFKNDMYAADWSSLYLNDNIDNMFMAFEDTFNKVLNKHAPLKQKFIRNSYNINKDKSWITEECKAMSTDKKNLLDEYHILKTDDSYAKYKQCRNKLNSMLNQTHKTFNAKLFEAISDEPKRWKFINNIRQSNNSNTAIKVLRNCFGDKVSDPKKLANYLNYMFTKLGDFTGKLRPAPARRNFPDHTFSFRYISEGEVLKVIRKIKSNKPTGPSKIPSWALKDADRSVSRHLTILINECITQHSFPDCLKQANIIPVFKKGENTDPINYRPIALTSIVSKIIERLLVMQINEYLDKHSLLSPFQFGFRKKFSTNDALLYVTEQFRTDISAGKTVSLAMLDLSKAFDSLSHSILTTKLMDLGFSDQAIQLLLNYLKNRQQKVIVNNTQSEWWETNQGVPQGTVLGPLLFLLYVNDMSDVIGNDCSIAQFADDTLLSVSRKDPEEAARILAHTVDKIVIYFESHKLRINVDKTKFMVLHGAKLKSKVELNNGVVLKLHDQTIEQVKEAKYLGIIFDQTLSFKTQVKKILKNMATGIKTIYTIRPYVPLKTRILLLHSLVLCHLNYPAVLLTGINNTVLESIEKQINWAIKACCFKRKFDHVTQLKKTNRILPARKQIEYICLTYFWKLVNNASEAFLGLNFPNFPLRHNIRRSTYTLNISAKNQKTEHIRKSFTSQSIESWNTLPVEIKSESSHKKFKHTLKCHLIKEYQNTPNNIIVNRAWDGFIVGLSGV